MPNRILKESICRSDSIDSLTWFEEVFFYRLLVVCDDFGRFDGRIQIIKGTCFPLKDITNKDIEKALNKLSAVGLVRAYEVQGRPYLQLVTWEKHQQIRAKKSKYPANESIGNHLKSFDIKCPRNPIQSESNPKSESERARENNISEYVNRFIEAYPLPDNQINRHLTEIAFIDCVMSQNVLGENLVIAAENYKDKLEKLGQDKEHQFIKKPENFLKDLEYCQYLPDVYKSPEISKTQKKNRFNDFKQNDYDFNSLEEQLLSR